MKKIKSITKKEVAHIAKLASLDLTEAELNRYLLDLEEIMNFMNQIKELDLKSISETSRTSEEENVLRDDLVTPSLTIDEALSNTKNTHDGFFLVPHVLVGKDS